MTDIAWGHVTEGIDKDGKKILTSRHCGKVPRGGGIFQMKQHLARVKGDIGKCPKVLYDVKFLMYEALKEIGVKNKEKEDFQKYASPYGATLHEFKGDKLDEECEEVSPSQMTMNEGGSSGDKKQCMSTKRKKPTAISNYFAPRTTFGSQPSIRSVLAGKEAMWRANMTVAQFFYDTCIPMNVLNLIYFQSILDVVVAIGSGYKQPTYNVIRVNLLRDAKNEVQLLVDSYKNIWEEVRCTLMIDGWTDTSHKSLINFLVYFPQDVCFTKSVDASGIVKDVFTLFKLFEDMALSVGPTNMVHIVTDNGANFKVVRRMLSEKYENITWSPCVGHCINLILKDIAELDHIVHLAKRLERNYMTGCNSFSYHFHGIKKSPIHEHKHDLQAMVTDRFFVDSRHAKNSKGKDVIPIILDNEFWDDMGKVSKIVAPLYDRVTFYKKPEVMSGFLDIVNNKASAFKDVLQENSCDPIDYESIDKIEFWNADDEQECGEFNLDELEQALYEEGSIPIDVGDHPYYDSTDVSQGIEMDDGTHGS
ncbi:uncharacterized protein LOC116126600 [Pistacia vera]|uniref:uncharacterized protein LOC116126600 n=1 Tax=Pistacia vera TaxID=55513 RepID=UPI001262C88D|nr:uncharacterized protein LOC116126600 [Pistacia vera]